MQTGPTVPGRSCEGCTKCCEGHLSATVNVRDTVIELSPKPCVFVKIGKGCGVYEERPKDPCKDFRCHYLVDAMVPEEMKPSRSNVILTIEEAAPGVEYVRATEAGGKLQAEYLAWLTSLYMNHSVNVNFTIDGRHYWLGDRIFTSLMVEKYGESNML